MNESSRAIRLANADGSLEITLAGWECPGETNGDGAYCVNVDVLVQHRLGEWRFRGDFCRIGSIEKLADWFDALGEGRKPDMLLIGGFMYPAFVFHVDGGGFNPNEYMEDYSPKSEGVFRVTLGGWPRPIWSPWSATRDESAFLNFPIVESNLRGEATELREQLRALPPP